MGGRTARAIRSAVDGRDGEDDDDHDHDHDDDDGGGDEVVSRQVGFVAVLLLLLLLLLLVLLRGIADGVVTAVVVLLSPFVGFMVCYSMIFS